MGTAEGHIVHHVLTHQQRVGEDRLEHPLPVAPTDNAMPTATIRQPPRQETGAPGAWVIRCPQSKTQMMNQVVLGLPEAIGGYRFESQPRDMFRQTVSEEGRLLT